MPDNYSTPFLPIGTQSVGKEVVTKSFFTSQNRHAQSEQGSPAHPAHLRRTKSDAAKFKAARGKMANLKVYDWRFSKAYRPTGEDTCHNRTYMTLPLDNVHIDNDLARVFLERGRAGGQAKGAHASSSETSYRATFPQRTGPQPPAAESYKPVHDEGFEEPMLETMSLSRRTYAWHDRDLARRFRGELVDPATNGSPLPDKACVAGRAASTVKQSHSAAELRGGFAPKTWHVAKPRGRAPPPGESW